MQYLCYQFQFLTHIIGQVEHHGLHMHIEHLWSSQYYIRDHYPIYTPTPGTSSPHCDPSTAVV